MLGSWPQMPARGHCCLELQAALGSFLQKLVVERGREEARHTEACVFKTPLERPSEKVLMDMAQPWVSFPPALKCCQAVGGQAKTDTPQWNADRTDWHQVSDKGNWCVLLINSLDTQGLVAVTFTVVLVTGGLCGQAYPPVRLCSCVLCWVPMAPWGCRC